MLEPLHFIQGALNEANLLHVAIDSLPKTDSLLIIDILSAALTPIIAVLAVYIAYQQHCVNRQRLQYELYERRLGIYKVVAQHLSHIATMNQITFTQCQDFHKETFEGVFLFSKLVQNYIDEIDRNSQEFFAISEELSLRKKPSHLDEKQREAKKQLLQWFLEKHQSSKEFFAKELGLQHRI